MSVLRVGTRLLGVATTLAVARLISPEEYGVFATILIAYQGLGMITDLSVSAAIIQMHQDPKRYLNTAWTLDVVRGLLLAVLMFLGASTWCDLFRVPQATPMLQALALVPLINAFHSVGPNILRRELRFGRIFILHATEAVTYSVIVVLAALLLHNAWALVLASISAFTARVIASHLLSPVRARIGFEYRLFLEMFRFSRWTNAHYFADFVIESADNAIVAAIVGTTALAFYRMGYQVAIEGATAFHWVVTTVAFSVFSRIQFDSRRVREGLRAMLGAMATGLLPATLLLIVLGPIAIPLVLGERWARAAEPLQLLAAAAFVRSILETARPVLLGLGRSGADLALKVVQGILMVGLAVPAAVVFGIQGVAVAVLIAATATLPCWWIALRKSTEITAGDLVGSLTAPVLAAGASLAVLAVMPAPQPTWGHLLGYSAVFTLSYGGVTILLSRLLPRSGFALAVRELR